MSRIMKINNNFPRTSLLKMLYVTNYTKQESCTFENYYCLLTEICLSEINSTCHWNGSVANYRWVRKKSVCKWIREKKVNTSHICDMSYLIKHMGNMHLNI